LKDYYLRYAFIIFKAIKLIAFQKIAFFIFVINNLFLQYLCIIKDN